MHRIRRACFGSLIEQGKKINTWGKNIYVKVPVVNSKNKFTGNVIKELNNKNIKLNITAVYTAKQTAKILKLICFDNQVPYIGRILSTATAFLCN